MIYYYINDITEQSSHLVKQDQEVFTHVKATNANIEDIKITLQKIIVEMSALKDKVGKFEMAKSTTTLTTAELVR